MIHYLTQFLKINFTQSSPTHSFIHSFILHVCMHACMSRCAALTALTAMNSSGPPCLDSREAGLESESALPGTWPYFK